MSKKTHLLRMTNVGDRDRRYATVCGSTVKNNSNSPHIHMIDCLVCLKKVGELDAMKRYKKLKKKK